MNDAPAARYIVTIEQGPPLDGLYDFEQCTSYCVVEAATGRVVLAFEGWLTASLSRDTGLWDDYQPSGVAAVALADDPEAVIVTYHDGRREIVRIPLAAQGPDGAGLPVFPLPS